MVRNVRWTDEEDAVLRREYAAEKKMVEIAKTLDRPLNAVLGRIHRLRLREEGTRPPDKFHPHFGRRKTPSPAPRRGAPGMPAIPPPRSQS